MALKSNAIVTLLEAKAYIGIEPSDTSEDGFLENAINFVSQFIEEYCGRPIKAKEITEFLDGGQKAVVLKAYPIVSVGGVWEDAERVFGGDTAVEFFYDPAGIVYREDGHFIDGRGVVKVIYTAGFEEVPSSIGQACLMMIRTVYERWKKGTEAMSTIAIGEGNIVYQANEWVPLPAREILNLYRRRGVA